MDPTTSFLIGLFLGFLSAFVWPLLRDEISKRKDRRDKAEKKSRVLKDLDAIASDVMAAVQVKPHGVQNKDKWVSRLQQFAKQYDDVLGPIAGYVNRISYKIEDSTFDHETLGNPPYCCDQVEEDLALLKLCILPVVAKELDWDSGTIEREEKQLLEKIWLNFQEVFLSPSGMPMKEYQVQQVNQWYAEWKTFKFKIHQSENLAMAPYVNHERKKFVT